MRAPEKKPGNSNRPRIALVVSVLVIAGGVGATVWIKMQPVVKTAANAERVTNNTPAVQQTRGTNEENADAFLSWLSNRTDAAELSNAGTDLLRRGRADMAILCYRKALELKPNDEEAHFNLGVAYGRIGSLTEAEKEYRAALKLFGDYTEAHNNLGNVLTRQKRFPEAVQEFEAALKLSPESASAHNNLGRVLAEQKKGAEALKHFLEAARLDTNYLEAHFNLGATYSGLGRTNDAIAEFNTVLRIRPGFSPAVEALARLQGAVP